MSFPKPRPSAAPPAEALAAHPSLDSEVIEVDGEDGGEADEDGLSSCSSSSSSSAASEGGDAEAEEEEALSEDGCMGLDVELGSQPSDFAGDCAESLDERGQHQLAPRATTALWQPGATGVERSPSVGGELPILQVREKVVAALFGADPVCCILGETGSGKSTQVPQVILHEMAERGMPAHIVVTQPRRVAAVNLARRVAQELGEAGAGLVGYRIGGESQPGRAIDFCTTGYLLQLLVNAPEEASRYTHVVLDEVHERTAESDMLCLVVRLLASRVNKGLRIVVMSATLQADLFAQYFGHLLGGRRPETLFVGARCFKVHEHFLDDVEQVFRGRLRCSRDVRFNVERMTKAKSADTVESRHVDHLQRVAIDVIQCIAQPGCTVLVFLPGIAEISALWEEARGLENSGGFRVFPLHSMIPREEQDAVFEVPAHGVTHVVLATDIAESSLTLPEVVAVLDFGIHRRIDHNDSRGMSCLATKWISRASAKQRSGRAGRTRPGVCVRLYPRALHDNVMPAYDAPEAESMPLEGLYLQAKHLASALSPVLGSTGPPGAMALIGQLVQPPREQAVLAAREVLAESGAITVSSESAAVTPLGDVCLALPLGLPLARLVWLGGHWGVAADAVVLACALASAEPFFSPTPLFIRDSAVFAERLRQSARSRLRFDGGAESEPLMLRSLFLKWLTSFGRVVAAQHLSSKQDVSRARQWHIEGFAQEHALARGRMAAFASQVLDVSLRSLRICDRTSRLADQLLGLIGCFGYSVNKRGDLTAASRGCFHDVRSVFEPDETYLKALLAASFTQHVLLGSYSTFQERRGKNSKKGKAAKTSPLAAARQPVDLTKQRKVLAEISANKVDPKLAAVIHKSDDEAWRYVEFVLGARPSLTCQIALDALGNTATCVQLPNSLMGQESPKLPCELSLLSQFCQGMTDLERVTRESGSHGRVPVEHPCMVHWEMVSTKTASPMEAICNRRNALGVVLRPPPATAPQIAVLAVAADVQAFRGGQACIATGVTALPFSFIGFILATAPLQSLRPQLTKTEALAVADRYVRPPEGLFCPEWWDGVRGLRAKLRNELLRERGLLPLLAESPVAPLARKLLATAKARLGDASEDFPMGVAALGVGLCEPDERGTAVAFRPLLEWPALQASVTSLSLKQPNAPQPQAMQPPATLSKKELKAQRKAQQSAQRKAQKLESIHAGLAKPRGPNGTLSKKQQKQQRKLERQLNAGAAKTGAAAGASKSEKKALKKALQKDTYVALCRKAVQVRRAAAVEGILREMTAAIEIVCKLLEKSDMVKQAQMVRQAVRKCGGVDVSKGGQPSQDERNKAKQCLEKLKCLIKESKAEVLPASGKGAQQSQPQQTKPAERSTKLLAADKELYALMKAAGDVMSRFSPKMRARLQELVDVASRQSCFQTPCWRKQLQDMQLRVKRNVNVHYGGHGTGEVPPQLQALEWHLEARGAIQKRALLPTASAEPAAKRPRAKAPHEAPASAPATSLSAAAALREGERELPRLTPGQPLPVTTEDWTASQMRLFGHLPPIPRPWIRVLSRSRGIVYYQNVETGGSCFERPAPPMPRTPPQTP